ncbi:MAG: exopolysaccharide Pel transporter PelG [Verrucomicrobiales bacterium]|nr:exopolysaccharide Pel transporter PelG [Verrucomicrobiales bacterium]
MAGIGFELRKISRSGSLESIFRSYAYSGIISSGPWIISIISLGFLTAILRGLLPQGEVAGIRLFSASVTHCYAFSLILVGPLQLVLTRHASDKFFAKDRDSIFPSCFGAMTLTAILSAIVGGFFFVQLVGGALIYRISATALMVVVACIFIISNYLTALRDYKSVVVSFASGYAASCLLACLGCKFYGIDAALFGFAAGHGVLLVLLLRCLHREFGVGGHSKKSGPWDFLRYFVRFPRLVLCGLFYNLGIWADKLMFWWLASGHEKISDNLYAAPTYDTAIYLSLLSIVPGLAVFFLKLETEFADRYQQFFNAIQNGGTLAQVRAAKTGVIEALRTGLSQLFKVQLFTTVLLVAFAKPLGERFGIGATQTGIFQITLFGAFLLVCFLSMLTALFYFDDQKGALTAAFVFAAANAGLGYLTIRITEAWYGFGFVVAAGLGMLIVASRLNHRVARLEEMAFGR